MLLTTRASAVAGELVDRMGAWASVTFLVLVGFLEGWALGALQWTVLSRFVPADERREWLIASSLGVGFGWLIALSIGLIAPHLVDLASAWVPLGAIAGGCAVGALIGGAEWQVLGGSFEGAARWMLANTVGWCLTIVPVLAAAPRLVDASTSTTEVVTSLLIGLTCAGLGAVIIGTALESVVRRPRAPR